MERTDIPAVLRGHRSALFGNLEKLRDFHQSQLLPELEKFQSYPHRIAGIFLRYVSLIFKPMPNTNVQNFNPKSQSLVMKCFQTQKFLKITAGNKIT